MKKIIIIGGGIAGLSAGIFAQKNGFESVIYEKHAISGGECTGWSRQGYHVDGCIHWLTGTKKGSSLYDLWCQIGGLGEGIEIYSPESFAANYYEKKEKPLVYWRDLDRLKREWTEFSPEDAAAIQEFVDDINLVADMEMPVEKPMDMMNIIDYIKLGKQMKNAGMAMNRLMKYTLSEYASRFQNPLIRDMIENSMPEGYSASAVIFSLATFCSGSGDIPMGGSLAFAKRIENKYLSLGGKLCCSAEADEIIIENGQAKGIRLKNGETVKGDYVVAACDAHFTLHHLLKEKYPVKELDDCFQNREAYPVPTSVNIALGVDADLSNHYRTESFPCEPFQLNNETISRIAISNYSYQKDFAPKGKTVVNSTINQSDQGYYYWKKLYTDNREQYNAEKQRLAEITVKAIEKQFPDLKGKIVILDVATPVTYERYCNAYHGAWMAFMMKANVKQKTLTGKIKGLKNCFLTGQWLQSPGGLPTAAATGKFVIQRICKNEKQSFQV